MLDRTGFNKWAETYDGNIENSSKGYPFEGYYDVLVFIQNYVLINQDTRILDLGIGTGLLTNDMYNRGAQILGVDFSEQMITEAKAKMPNASFISYDFNDTIPNEILNESFDYIVSSYAIHHVKDERKLALIKALMNSLKEDGKILIADVAFETAKDQDTVKNGTQKWDEEEYYMVGEKMKSMLAAEGIKSEYQQISICAGVLEIEKGQ